jgi:hypothetical protein
MKYYITLLVLGFSLLSKAQTKIKFSYDDAGNQISRILCINCTSKSVKEVKEIKAIVEDDLEKFSKEDVISYYPNPVKEELYLQWELAQDNYVKFVQVYSMTGQVLRNYQTNETTKNLIISFQNFPSGVYIVLLSYKAGEDKSIKIVKQ